ncbi:uncharacterized protein B0I36DRAFT_117787 [Microdochium trichocladiopsis]|uniref:Ubiquitin-like protease family profile domain-containing protein n=1 Tax=Microdochium trichocladiopsis TaxID=1682393 RepID=A0A9P8Y4H6_9PEZI|nr:uncharacterized protein B0I36DRAFT_117787 [Microdochium trichocladiopsis]KAH7031027.1 hypothetical protein B0I36DRAFT_117787 [Microdochium trichocladiopsis]
MFSGSLCQDYNGGDGQLASTRASMVEFEGVPKTPSHVLRPSTPASSPALDSHEANDQILSSDIFFGPDFSDEQPRPTIETTESSFLDVTNLQDLSLGAASGELEVMSLCDNEDLEIAAASAAQRLKASSGKTTCQKPPASTPEPGHLPTPDATPKSDDVSAELAQSDSKTDPVEVVSLGDDEDLETAAASATQHPKAGASGKTVYQKPSVSDPEPEDVPTSDATPKSDEVSAELAQSDSKTDPVEVVSLCDDENLETAAASAAQHPKAGASGKTTGQTLKVPALGPESSPTPDTTPNPDPTPSKNPKTRKSLPQNGQSTEKPTARDGDLTYLHDEDFAKEMHARVKYLSARAQPPSSYSAILSSLTEHDHAPTRSWTDGQAWSRVLENSLNDRRRSTIYHVLAAIAFLRWYEVQQSLECERVGCKPQEAGTRVLSRLSESGPQLSDDLRKRWNTHLTRGRKWDKLCNKFGLGTLLADAWSFGKQTNKALEESIARIEGSAMKQAILKAAEVELRDLISRGQTDNKRFGEALAKLGFTFNKETKSESLSEKITRLREPLGKVSKSGTVFLGDFHFEAECVSRLNTGTWFNQDLVLLAMHLADKLSNVRVGFSIPIHGGGGKALAKPFERAAKQVQQWTEEGQDCIGFFPLFLNDNHFTLLEIDAKKSKIFHYDSMNLANEDVKNACRAQFRDYMFHAQTGFIQNDSSSCGPLVVETARLRMLGMPVPSQKQGPGAEELRVTICETITRALHSNIFKAVKSSKRKSEANPTETPKKKSLEGSTNKRKAEVEPTETPKKKSLRGSTNKRKAEAEPTETPPKKSLRRSTNKRKAETEPTETPKRSLRRSMRI